MKALVGFVLSLGAVGAGVYLAMRDGGGSLSGARGRRRTNLRGDAEVGELKAFIDNDGDLYRQQYTPILKNLVTKMARGVFDRAKAEKLWMYLVESGAKKYAKENDTGVWHQTFSMSDRKAVAKHLNDDFVEEAKTGNYDHLLPKKYMTKAEDAKRRLLHRA